MILDPEKQNQRVVVSNRDTPYLATILGHVHADRFECDEQGNITGCKPGEFQMLEVEDDRGFHLFARVEHTRPASAQDEETLKTDLTRIDFSGIRYGAFDRELPAYPFALAPNMR